MFTYFLAYFFLLSFLSSFLPSFFLSFFTPSLRPSPFPAPSSTVVSAGSEGYSTKIIRGCYSLRSESAHLWIMSDRKGNSVNVTLQKMQSLSHSPSKQTAHLFSTLGSIIKCRMTYLLFMYMTVLLTYR